MSSQHDETQNKYIVSNTKVDRRASVVDAQGFLRPCLPDMNRVLPRTEHAYAIRSIDSSGC